MPMTLSPDLGHLHPDNQVSLMDIVVLVTNRWLNQEVKLSAVRYPEAIQSLQNSSSPQLILLPSGKHSGPLYAPQTPLILWNEEESNHDLRISCL